MKKPIKIIIILLVIIAVGGYFGYRLIIEKKAGNGKSGKETVETEKHFGYAESDLLEALNAYKTRFNRDTYNREDLTFAGIREMTSGEFREYASRFQRSSGEFSRDYGFVENYGIIFRVKNKSTGSSERVFVFKVDKTGKLEVNDVTVTRRGKK